MNINEVAQQPVIVLTMYDLQVRFPDQSWAIDHYFLCCRDLCLEQLAGSDSFFYIAGVVQEFAKDGTVHTTIHRQTKQLIMLTLRHSLPRPIYCSVI